MTFKLIDKLTTRAVETFETEYYGKGFADKAILTRSAGAVRAALDWYQGEKPDPDVLEPAQVVELCTDIFVLYNKTLGFDLPNLPKRSRTTPKA